MLRLRHPISLFAIVLLVLLGVLRSFSTPTPVGADAPDVVFSAVRAEAILDDLLKERLPHVAGSPQNAVVQERIEAQLTAFGYTPQVQSLFHCNPMFGSCSPVQNIIAEKPGTEGKSAILLTAHYDSGWTGPGAADDGAGVAAILEIARMAADFPPFANDVIFLFSDSEENGLIGADAFAQQHPLFRKVKTVINLEARGSGGPSALFETGEGNRGLIRMFSKNVERPVGNSLAYEMYKRMPNDTDYSVYKAKGIMGANFAFAQGVPVYHSAIDDPEHLDLGSLQHHGDNAWYMLLALGDRALATDRSREDAGYIDVFASQLVHYPVSITSGLVLVFGVWVMIAIGLAFRKEFRFRQLRWGLLAVPLMLLAIAAGGYLLSWPLGRWPDLHPIEHPYPWLGRVTLFLMLLLVVYTTLKLFSGRVSACAWMILAWGLVFVLGIVLTSKLPAASHIALIPLALFALGSAVDSLRKKSPAPLLIASLSGFAAATFISIYHFLMLDVVMNFDQSHFKVVTFWLMALVVMPMLFAFVKQRDLGWRPALGLLATILVLCAVQFLLPGFTAERPRGMTLVYSEHDGDDQGFLMLESLHQQPDFDFASGHAFVLTEIDSGRLGTVERPVRRVTSLDLPGVELAGQDRWHEQDGWHHAFTLDLPADSPFTRLSFPEETHLDRILVNGQTALDASIPSKRKPGPAALKLIYPGQGPYNVELVTASEEPFAMSVVTWHKLPDLLAAPFLGNWPHNAQPFLYGPRAEKIQAFEVGTRQPGD